MSYFWIALGGALGSGGRYWISELLALRFGPAFPSGTLLVNVSGSFAIGFVAGFSSEHGRLIESSFVRQFVMGGVCGGYPTFSAFSLQTLAMLPTGDLARAGINVGASVIFCLLAAWAGYLLAAAWSRAAAVA